MIAVGALEQPPAPGRGGGARHPGPRDGRERPGRRGMPGGPGGAGSDTRLHVFEGESHASAVPVALGRALPFLLAGPGADRGAG